MKKTLGVAVCQMNSTDDVEQNSEQILSLLDQIKKNDDIDLACFPENSLYLRIKEGEKIEGIDLQHSVFSRLAKESRERDLVIHLGSVALKAGGRLTNASISISPTAGAVISYEKIHLFDIDIEGHGPVRESDVYKNGETPQILDVQGWQIGQTICYDLRFAELFTWYARHGVEALLVPSSFLVPTGQMHWHVLLRARAIESQAYVLAAAQAGTHRSGRAAGSRETYGHSLVVDPWGKIMAEALTHGPEVLKVHLELDRVQSVRRQIPMHGHRRLVAVKR
jgi:predicted amidohydrolase